MKSVLCAVAVVCVLAGNTRPSDACEGSGMMSLVSDATSIQQFFGPLDVPMTPQTFFCEGDKLILHWFDINEHTTLSHAMTFEASIPNCSAVYPPDWFEAFYAQVAAQGTVDVFIGLTEFTKFEDGTCQRVLSEFVEIIDAACLFQEEELVLENKLVDIADACTF